MSAVTEPQIFQPGERISGRYEIDRLIGRGGLAEVYLVRHADLGSLHALKVLLLQRQSIRDRFLMEGRIQAQLRHPNVVPVTDILRHEGRIGLLMEYVDNVSLDVFIQRKGPLAVSDALHLMAPILAGVHAAHKAGVLHRDLKPANILLARTPTGLVPKVTDFGIAKVVDEGLGPSRTREGVAMGTPGYMAPEQVLDSRSVDVRTDVFAVAAIFYELLSGQRAFVDEFGEVSVKSTLEGIVTPLSELVPGTPQFVCDAICKAISREREDRFPDVVALAAALFVGRDDLLAWVEGNELARPVTVNLSLPSSLSNAGTGSRSLPTYTPSFLSTPSSDETRQPLWPLLALAAVMSVVVVAVVYTMVAPSLVQPTVATATPNLAILEQTPMVGSMRVSSGSGDPSNAANSRANAADLALDDDTDLAGQTAPLRAQPTARTVVPRQPDNRVVDGLIGDSDPMGEPTEPAMGEGEPDNGGAGTDPTGTEQAVAAGTADVTGAAQTTASTAASSTAASPPKATLSSGAAFHGAVYGQPLSLHILKVDGRNVLAEARMSKGASYRILDMSGSFNPDTGHLEVYERGGSSAVKGTISKTGLNGAFYRGKRSQDIALGRE